MTTKDSPHAVLKAQADQIAHTLKAAERGDAIDARFAEKIAKARANPTFKTAVVMDDKIITLELPWEVIRSSNKADLSAFILAQMKKEAK